MGELIKMKSRLNEEREWVDLCDKYAAIIYRKDQQILALYKQNEMLYEQVDNLQKLIMEGMTHDKMPQLQQQQN